jgi:hypothetical protein
LWWSLVGINKEKRWSRRRACRTNAGTASASGAIDKLMAIGAHAETAYITDERSSFTIAEPVTDQVAAARSVAARLKIENGPVATRGQV